MSVFNDKLYWTDTDQNQITETDFSRFIGLLQYI
jgi:hypothetical protein